MSHPNGVRSSCSQDLYSGPDVRTQGLGLLSLLSDELLVEVLHLLSGAQLAAFACCSRVCYAFCQHEDLWKALLLQDDGADFPWSGTWQRSFIATNHPSHPLPTPGSGPTIRAPGLFSDLLYQPWLCAHVDIAQEWLEVDNIDRRLGLTRDQFVAEYEAPNRPVVLTDVVPAWPAFTRWSDAYLRAAFAGQRAIVGNGPMALDTFLAYQAATGDELPLVLFDKSFATSAPQLARDYSVPPHFSEDLFALLGPSRPDHRWLIMGPPRSGSSFHVDPNATSAWNALLRGRKKWILYPPGAVPPGVHPSPDGADVATPLSLLEWFLNFYDHTRRGKVRPVECVVEAGELIFVPRGWWHLALNLEPSLALTHNYVSAANLAHVLAFLGSRRQDLVSGCALDDRGRLHDRFVAALQAQRPELLEKVQEQRRAKRQKLEEQGRLSAMFKGADSSGEGKGAAAENSGGGSSAVPAPGGFTFSFAFGGAGSS